MKRTETIPPCPENGQALAGQYDPSLCPTWCSGEHLSTSHEQAGGGFHHDRAQWALLPAAQSADGGSVYVYVNVSQLVPVDRRPEPAVVELSDGLGRTHSLSPDEAIRVGEALVVAAAEALA